MQLNNWLFNRDVLLFSNVLTYVINQGNNVVKGIYNIFIIDNQQICQLQEFQTKN